MNRATARAGGPHSSTSHIADNYRYWCQFVKGSQNYCFFFLLCIEYASYMLHFASYFLAQQLICCVHVFGCKNAPLVQGDHPSPGRGQAITPTMDEFGKAIRG